MSKTPTLKPSWSINMTQDLKAMYGIDVETVLDHLAVDGVYVIPFYQKESITEKPIENCTKYKMVGMEMSDYSIEIIKDITKKHKRGTIISRSEFDEDYFTEAI